MLEALALNGTPMSAAGFKRFVNALLGRARAVAAEKLRPPTSSSLAATGGGSAPTQGRGPSAARAREQPRAHAYFHLDLREISTLSPVLLRSLLEKQREFSKVQAEPPMPNPPLQPKSWGPPKS